MFTLTKHTTPKTIILTSADILCGNAMQVSTSWQERHSPHDMTAVLYRAVNTSSSTFLDTALTTYLQARSELLSAAKPIDSLLFTHDTGISGNIRHLGAEYQVDIKGMPEHIIELCDMTDNERESITLQLHAMSGKGLHVIALATGIMRRQIVHASDFTNKDKLTFVGFIALDLPVSVIARHAFQQVKKDGLSLYFITGIHPAATYHLCNDALLASKPHDIYDSRHLDIKHAAQIQKAITQWRIFARTSSLQKDSLIATIKASDPTTTTVNSIADLQKLLATKG